MPYEAITKDRYTQILASLKSTKPDFLSRLNDGVARGVGVETPADAFCDACEQP
jgi:hypothetical protein